MRCTDKQIRSTDKPMGHQPKKVVFKRRTSQKRYRHAQKRQQRPINFKKSLNLSEEIKER